MGERVRRKSLATAQAVVDAARDLLAEGGAAEAALEAVARRADVAVQTIYNRVGGRTALLQAVAERALAANRAYMDPAYAEGGPVLERLRRVTVAYVTFAVERPYEFQLLAFPQPGAPTEGAVEELVALQNGKLAALLREGVADGTLDPDLDPDVVATVLWRMVDGVIGLAFRPDGLRVDVDDLPALLGAAGAVLERGLVAGPPYAPGRGD